MKLFSIIFILLLVAACTGNDHVYWCGDHACVNNKERQSYFKKTMIVEIRDSKEIVSRDKIKEKEIKKQIKFEKKRKRDEEKRLKKQAKLEAKIKLKEEKDSKKRSIIRKESKINTSDNKIKNEDDKMTSDSYNEEKKTKLAKKQKLIKNKSFEDIVKQINENSKMKTFPDINSVPE